MRRAGTAERQAVGRREPGGSMAARQRSTSRATDSNTARARSPGPWAAPRPTNAAPRLAAATTGPGHRPATGRRSRPGPRGARPAPAPPSSAGVDPHEPAEPGQERAGRRQAALELPAPVGRPGHHGRRGPGRGGRPRGSRRWPSSPSSPSAGAVVAPRPSTSHCRSPAPMTTGVPGRQPELGGRTARAARRSTASGATTGGSVGHGRSGHLAPRPRPRRRAR